MRRQRFDHVSFLSPARTLVVELAHLSLGLFAQEPASYLLTVARAAEDTRSEGSLAKAQVLIDRAARVLLCQPCTQRTGSFSPTKSPPPPI